jgi:hypothetical protein
MNKKILFYSMMAATMIMTATTTNAETFTGECGEALTWTLDTDSDTLRISGTGKMTDFFEAPWFNYREHIKHVVVDSGVTTIGNNAFKWQNMSMFEQTASPLESVTLPKGLLSIGNSAFEDCSSLTSITIPEGVTSIGKPGAGFMNFANTFKGCTSLESVILPKTLQYIGGSAFEECTALSSIDLPEGLKTIEDNAFNGCTSLSSITMYEGMHIGHAFYGCTGLTSVYNYAFTLYPEPSGSSFSSILTTIGDVNNATPLNNVDLFVPPSAVKTYKEREKEFKSIQPIADWVPVTGVQLDRTTIPLAPKGKVKIKATVLPANASNKSLHWSREGSVSFDEMPYESFESFTDTYTIVAYDKKGATAVIKVTTTDGAKTASCKVVITNNKAAAKAPAKTPAKKK